MVSCFRILVDYVDGVVGEILVFCNVCGCLPCLCVFGVLVSILFRQLALIGTLRLLPGIISDIFV